MADAEADARLRLIVALEEVRRAARALGLDAEAISGLHAPFAMRADAWCHRIDREAIAWARVTASPLCRKARARAAAA